MGTVPASGERRERVVQTKQTTWAMTTGSRSLRWSLFCGCSDSLFFYIDKHEWLPYIMPSWMMALPTRCYFTKNRTIRLSESTRLSPTVIRIFGASNKAAVWQAISLSNLRENSIAIPHFCDDNTVNGKAGWHFDGSVLRINRPCYDRQAERICFQRSVPKNMRDDCVGAKTEYFCDVALLWIIIKKIRMRDISLSLCYDMAVSLP